VARTLPWAGAARAWRLPAWAAVFLGGGIAALPGAMAVCRPGAVLPRHCIAVGQMLTSALLIHLTGGRIETHFHVFGSLALLAWYRDPGVLVLSTIVVAADHFLRGFFYPQSVYGVLSATPWRSFEHAFWVLFENTFLWITMRQSLRILRALAMNHAAIKRDHAE